MALLYTGIFFLISGSLESCINMKSISKGSFNDQLQYNYSYFVYSNISLGSRDQRTKNQTESCRVYLADIRSGRNHILEKIVFYNCSFQPPFKIKMDYDEKGKMTGQRYFLSVTDSSYTNPVSSEEKLLFLEMGKRQMPGDYADYPLVSGFRPATPADSIEALPFLKDVAKIRVM